MLKAVIHLPKKREETEQILHEIALFRADKTMKILREEGITPEQLQVLLQEINRGKELLSSGRNECAEQEKEDGKR